MKNLAAALVKFQTQCESIKFDSVNPHFKSKFASLAAIHHGIGPALSANGLAVIQFPHSTETGIGVRTILIHESGEMLEHTYTLPLAKNDPQGGGSAITYARRYGLSGALGIVTEEDDDGESSMTREAVRSAGTRRARSSAPRAPKSTPAMSQENRDKIKHAADLRVKDLDDGTIGAMEIITTVASQMGYDNPKAMKDEDFLAALEAVQTFEPGSAAA